MLVPSKAFLEIILWMKRSRSERKSRLSEQQHQLQFLAELQLAVTCHRVMSPAAFSVAQAESVVL